MKICVIDYGAGNVKSVENAVERLGYHAFTTAKKEKIRYADSVIFPGVGHAQSAKRELQKLKLWEMVPTLQQPVLGICLGLQLMCKFSEEGSVEGLSIFSNTIKQFKKDKNVPHMGWNRTELCNSPLFMGLNQQEDFYYVHSYAAEINDKTVATCRYGTEDFSAALQSKNFFATQFHPEKSGSTGEQILKNFLEKC